MAEGGTSFEATAGALVAWANTFEQQGGPVTTSLAELSDGVRVAEILHDIDPARFEKSLAVRSSRQSWAVAVNNWNRLLKAMAAYFVAVLELRVSSLDADHDDTEALDPTRLGKEKDGRQLAEALSLVLFAAMRAPQERLRGYIDRIMTLPSQAQLTIKGVLETVQAQRVRPLSPSAALALESEPLAASDADAASTVNPAPPLAAVSTPSGKGQRGMGMGMQGGGGMTPPQSTPRGLMTPGSVGGGGGGTPSQALEELSKSLRAERDDKARLLQESATLRTRLAEATEELGEAQRQLLKKGEEGEEWRKRMETAAAKAEELRANCDRLRVRAEERGGEVEQLRREMQEQGERAQADKEKLERAEEACRRLADEVDVLRTKAQEAAVVEGQLDRYRAKMEQAAATRQALRELEAQNAKYLDQILALEDEVKTIGALKKAVEQYKERVLELEREKFKAQEGVQLKEAEAARLREEAEAAVDTRRFMQEEVEALKRALAAASQGGGSVQGLAEVGTGEGGGGGLFGEGVAGLRERFARAERENKALKKRLEVGGWPQGGGEEGDVLLLQSRLEELERLKGERETEAIESKKRAAALEADLKAQRAQNEELEDELTRARKEAAATPAHEKRILQLKKEKAEAESRAATLREEKERLEQYTKQTLQQVQSKYVKGLEKLKEANGELKERNRYLEARMDYDRAAQKREERLLVGAVYELGMDMIAANYKPAGGAGAAAPDGAGEATAGAAVSSSSRAEEEKER